MCLGKLTLNNLVGLCADPYPVFSLLSVQMYVTPLSPKPARIAHEPTRWTCPATYKPQQHPKSGLPLRRSGGSHSEHQHHASCHIARCFCLSQCFAALKGVSTSIKHVIASVAVWRRLRLKITNTLSPMREHSLAGAKAIPSLRAQAPQ